MTTPLSLSQSPEATSSSSSSPSSFASRDEDGVSSTNAATHSNTTTTSPEAAGILRGASRTVLQSLAKRTNQIRKVASKSPTTDKIWLESINMSSWKFPKLKSTVKPKTVAQVSDRMAVGMDLVTVAIEQQQEQQQHSNSNSSTTTNSTKDVSPEKKTVSFENREGNQSKGRLVGDSSIQITLKWKHYRESVLNITYSTFVFYCIVFV
jgi:hypothetical protein